MTIRVLICRSNPVAPDPRVEKIAGALAGLGYPVQILCWDRTGQLASGDELEGQGERIPIHRLQIVGKFGHGLGNIPGLMRWQWGLSR